MFENFRRTLATRTDAASLATFRFLFGWLMFLDAIRYLRFGWVDQYYIEPQFHFTFYGFHWLKPWPGIGMYIHFGVLSLCALGIAFGCFYRLAASVFTIGFAYVFLAEKAHYLNHFYVIILISGLMTVVPAHHLWSMDAAAGRVKERNDNPSWPVWLIRAQLFIIYVYAGIAKLNADWFNGEPMRLWLGYLHEKPLLGSIVASEGSAMAASYLGVAIDLFLPFLLLWRRTRVFALIAFACFHLTNAYLFSIGIFPWMMLGANLIFLDTDWPRKLPKRTKSFLPLPDDVVENTSVEIDRSAQSPIRTFTLWALGIHLALQIAIPLRHHLYPGDVAWTEEGHRFSWRMKLRDKRGTAVFRIKQPDESSPTRINLDEELPKWMHRKMNCEPDMLLMFARHLGDKYQKEGQERPAVYVETNCSLNSHPHGPLIDPSVDLGRQEDSLQHVSWILPRPINGKTPDSHE